MIAPATPFQLLLIDLFTIYVSYISDQIISGAQLYLHKATASGEDKGNDAAKLSDRWLFEETRLPNNHLVAVCSDLAPPRHSDPPCRFTDRTFKEVKISDLIKDAGRLHCPVLAEWTDFDAKHYHAQLGVRSISGSLNEGHLEF